MTWIVGTLTPFGLGIVASDIRVTRNDKTEIDCLQKIFQVGGGLLAGFSGSVKIGFLLKQALAKESGSLPQDKAWDLNVIANTWWPDIARDVYSSASDIQKNLGCRMILVGTHPNRNQGPFPQIDMFTFSAPDFQPEKSTAIASIGCGARAPDCMKIVKDAFAMSNSEFLMLYQAGPLGLATGVGATLQDAIQQNPIVGVSMFFQVAVVGRGFCQFIHSAAYFKEDGKEVKFPEVATDYDSLNRLFEKNGWNAATSVC